MKNSWMRCWISKIKDAATPAQNTISIMAMRHPVDVSLVLFRRKSNSAPMTEKIKAIANSSQKSVNSSCTISLCKEGRKLNMRNYISFGMNLCTALTSGYPLLVLFLGFRCVTNHFLQLTNLVGAFILALAIPLVWMSYSTWQDWLDFEQQYPRWLQFGLRLFGLLMGGIGWLPFSTTWADDLLLNYVALTFIVLIMRLNILPAVKQFQRIRSARRCN